MYIGSGQAKEMDEWLIALAVFAEDLHLILRYRSQLSETPLLRILYLFLASVENECTWNTDIQARRTLTHMKKNIIRTRHNGAWP